ncbi:MAG: hypothetical protein JRJ87_12645, partial [Deltaproteobacteria bacterium]|nr:hypothetical protein [Deltaproteobacteria bacterium]
GPLQKKLLEAASWLIPFLNANLEVQSSPFWEGRSGDEPHPSPWSMHQIFETKQNVGLGCSILHAKTPYKNIFYCGPEAIPGLGIEGAAYAARQTGNLIQAKMKLKKVI